MHRIVLKLLSSSNLILLLFLIHQIDSKIIYGSKNQYYYEETLPYIKSTTPEISIALLIDVSESQFNKIHFACQDLIHSIKQLRETYSSLDLSVSTFTDKPISPLGFNLPTWKDYCLDIQTVFEDHEATHQQALQNLIIGGGQDFAESQLDSLYRLSIAPQLHWKSDNGIITSTNKPYAKIIILVTDALYHTSGDVKKALQAYSPFKGLKEKINVQDHNLSSLQLKDDPNAQCDKIDYPSVAKLSQLLKEKHYLPIILTAPAHYICADDMTKTCPYPEMDILATQLNNTDYADTVKGMELIYTNLLQELDVTGIVQHVEMSSTNFTASLVDSIKTLLTYRLPIETTKTVPQSDAVPCENTLVNNDCNDNSEISVKINVTVT